MSILKIGDYSGTNGVYAGVNIESEGMIARIHELCDDLGLERVPVDDVHCTLVYSRENAVKKVPQIKQPINALLTSVQHWVGHNGKTYVVADVQSMALAQLHARFHELGARHSFAAYRPHVTLGKIEKVSENFEELIEELNWRLKSNPIHVVFTSCVVNDIRQD